MLRTKFASVLDGVKLPELVLALRSRSTSPWITVLTYHRVARPESAAPFDEGVVDVTPDAFDRQMAFVRRWFDVIGIDELARFRRGERLPRNPLLVTFDDGYLDNHDAALPILEKYGVRAVFFIATSYLAERRLFWWDKINYLLRAARRASVEVEIRTPSESRRERLDLAHGPGAAIRRALRVVKDTYALDLPGFLDSLQAGCDVALSREAERRLADSVLMTWDHVRALRRAGMDVQSHTSTHRVLQTVPARELAAELEGSRRVLEDVLAEKVRAVSYPVGKPLAEMPHVRRAVADAGYELGFSNATGINHRSRFDPLDAKRISLDAALPDPFFRAMLAVPYLSY